jgi:hypothetical protein
MAQARQPIPNWIERAVSAKLVAPVVVPVHLDVVQRQAFVVQLVAK